MEDALALVSGDAAELGHPQRQVAVGVASVVEDEARARAVHRPHREAAGVFVALALGRLGEVHVLAVVVVVAGAVPELLVEDLRGVDPDVAVLVELLADPLARSASSRTVPCGSQKGIPGDSSRNMKRSSCGPSLR